MREGFDRTAAALSKATGVRGAFSVATAAREVRYVVVCGVYPCRIRSLSFLLRYIVYFVRVSCSCSSCRAEEAYVFTFFVAAAEVRVSPAR